MSSHSQDVLQTMHGGHRMAYADVTHTLSTVFKGVKPKFLEELVAASFLRSYPPGSEIYLEGSYGQTMFLVLQGQLSLDALTDEGAALTVRRLGEGDTFGEAAILGRTRRSTTARALSLVLLLEMEKVRIERLQMKAETVIPAIEERVARTAMEVFLRQHRGFSLLSDSDINDLVDASTLETCERHSTLFEAGDESSGVLIIKAGVTKLFRKSQDRISVLAYYNSGDVAGLSDQGNRLATLQAMGFVEYLRVDGRVFHRIQKRAEAKQPGWSLQFRKSEADKSRLRIVNVGTGDLVGPNATVQGFIEDFVADGAQMAQSLLTIDLDLCVRCGNCTRACEARHGHAKMTRRGKKLVRRRDLQEQGSYQPVLLPSSCRHCDSPECMIDCPTGAIHRKPTGEVSIHDFCIGCSNCALRCPWDNITMVPTPKRSVGNLATPFIASKCDLCADYDGANCVNNCPTKAILRVEPNSYFPELRAALGTPDQAKGIGEDTATNADRDWSVPVLLVSSLMVAALLGWLRLSTENYHASTAQGGWLGIAAATLMVGAVLLSIRRRLASLPRKPKAPRSVLDPKLKGRVQLGPFYIWVRAHIAVGVLGLVAVLLHSDLRLGGLVTSLLMGFLLLEILTGIFGAVYYRWLPKVITRIEGEAQVQEDAEDERRALKKRKTEILIHKSRSVVTAARNISKKVGGALACLSSNYDRDRRIAETTEALEPQLAKLASEERMVVERLIGDEVRNRELRAMGTLYAVRTGWLTLHVGVSAVLVTLLVVHIASVFRFGWGLGS